MVKDVVSVSPEDDLFIAIKRMNEFGWEKGIINQLVVIEDGEIKGIVSDGDVIRAMKGNG